MKKLGLIVTGTSLAIMMAGTALAAPYAVNFDPDPTDGDVYYVSETIYGWDLEAYNKESVPVANGTTIFGTGTGAVVDIVTHQQLNGPNVGNVAGVLDDGDTFYENITITVLNGLGPPPGYASLLGQPYGGFAAIVPPANLYIDLSLAGFITGYSAGAGPATTATTPTAILNDTYTSIFTSGAASMYVDNNANFTFDGGDVLVASFLLDSSGPFILTPSVFSGAGAQISYGFENTYANAAYFSNAPGFADLQDMITNSLLFTLTQGGVAFIGGQIGGLTGPDPDEILIAFQETGFDAKFDAIPEPTSMLLLGTGLVGLAGASRRRKKAAKK